jgi:hypothetical protein
VFSAALLLSATAVSLDVPGLAAEVIGVTRGPVSTRVEFRIINETTRAVDASRLFSGKDRRASGTVAGVRAAALPAGRDLPLRRDSRGVCRCSRDVSEILPRWHRDLEAEFPPVPPETLVRIEIPHYPPIEAAARPPR